MVEKIDTREEVTYAIRISESELKDLIKATGYASDTYSSVGEIHDDLEEILTVEKAVRKACSDSVRYL